MTKLEGIVYLAINKINNKIYIGQTINTLNRRKTNHYAAEREQLQGWRFEAIEKFEL